MIQLAYSSNAYMRFSVAEAIRRIAALGYVGIELMADEPHLFPATTSDDKIDSVRRLLDELGLSIANVNAFMMNAIGDKRHVYWHPSWIEPDASYRQIRIQHTIDALTLARKLGAKCITTEPGGPLRGGLLEDGMSRQWAMETFVAGLKQALCHAERQNVMLLVEPEPGLLIENVAQCLELSERIDSPAFGINFDIGHMYCVGEPLPQAVAQLAHLSKHYHVEDIAPTRVHKHLIPGQGAIDFAPVFQAIRDSDYAGWITVELYPYLDNPDLAGAQARDSLARFMG